MKCKAITYATETNFKHELSPIHANVSFIHSLKTSEKLWFSDVFRGYRNGTIA